MQAFLNSSRQLKVYGLCGFFFACYALLAKSWPSLEDASEFVLSAHYLGISHPPGYPLFSLIGKIATFFPFFTPAYKIHLLTSLFATVTLYCCAQIVQLLSRSQISVFFVVGLLGGSGFFIVQAVTAEVYIFNLMFFCWLFYLACRLHFFNCLKDLLFFSAIFGLALTNHWPLMLLSFPALFVLVYPSLGQHKRYLGVCVLLFLVGLSPYLHLMWAHHYSDFIFSDPLDSLEALWGYVSREEYRLHDQQTYVELADRLMFFLDGSFFLGLELSLLALPFAGLGLYRFYQKDRSIFLSFVLAIGSSLVFLVMVRSSEFSPLAKSYFRSYQMIPLASLAILAACGFEKYQTRKIYLLAGLAFLCSHFLIHTYRASQRLDSFSSDFAQLILESLPKDAVLFVKGDSDAGPITYQHYLNNVRSDILLISQVSAFLPHKIFSRTYDIPDNRHKAKIISFIDEQLESNRRVFSTNRFVYFEKKPSEFPFRLIPYGLYFEVVRTNQKPHAPTIDQTKISEFINHYLFGHYSRRWNYHREQVLSHFCHYLLLNGLTHHEAFAKISQCKLVKAQFLNVHKLNLGEANQLYLELISASRMSTSQTRSSIYREFLVNFTHWLTSQKLNKGQALQQYRLLLDTVRPILRDFPTCKNEVALNYYQIAMQLKLPVDWEFYNRNFSRCVWAKKLVN